MKKLRIILLFVPFILLANTGLEIPSFPGDSEIETHTGYTLSYSERYEQAYWVAYDLTREEVSGSVARKDSFRSDSSIDTGSASLSDYKGSGYDRGHLIPAADLKWSYQAMSDSFYMSNMSPQLPGFNRGIWKSLEEEVRDYAYHLGQIYVATGPVLTGSYKTIGSNQVAVPDYYYKAILYVSPDGDMKSIGFLMPNMKLHNDIYSYSVSIDRLEEVTGIDFFYLLEDDIEIVTESSKSVSFFKSIPDYKSYTVKKEITSQEPEATGKYWINSSNMTRHNENCRYYGKTKNGYYTDKKEGTACGMCGG